METILIVLTLDLQEKTKSCWSLPHQFWWCVHAEFPMWHGDVITCNDQVVLSSVEIGEVLALTILLLNRVLASPEQQITYLMSNWPMPFGIAFVVDSLNAAGFDAHRTREPSDGPVGRLLREFLAGAHAPADATTLAFVEKRRGILATQDVERVSDADLRNWRNEPLGPDPDANTAPEKSK